MLVMPAAAWSWLKRSIPPDWFFLNLKSRQSFWFPIDTRPDFASLNLPNQLEGQAVSLDFAYTRCFGLTRDAAGAGVVHVWLFHLAQTLSQALTSELSRIPSTDLCRPNVAWNNSFAMG